MKAIGKLLFFLALLISSHSLSAQLSVGGGLSFGTGIENIGLFARGGYDITDEIRGNATVNFFFGENVEGIVKTSLWTINLDGHYVLVDEDNLAIYGLAGLNIGISRVKFDDPTGIIGSFSDSETNIGLNAGGGVELPLDAINPFAEVKYVIGGFDQLVIVAGVRYPLN